MNSKTNKMKKLILLLAIACIGAANLSAQVDSPNSIGLSVGIITAPDFIEYAQPSFTGIESSLITKNTTTSIPVFLFEYNRALGQHVDLGFSIGYQQFKSTYVDAFFESFPAGETQTHFLSIMPQFRFHYIPVDSWLGLYSGAAVGLHYQVIDARDITLFDVESSGSVGFSWQVTAIGVEVGNKFGAHAELGFGFKGIISAGLHARF
jgi:hypothetical protein